MNLVLPLAAIAAFLLLGSKSSASSAPKGVVTPGEPTVIKRAPAKAPAKKATTSDALQAAQLAEKQTRAPQAQQAVMVNKGVAQTVKGAVLPPGYDRVQANAKAQSTADHVRTRKGKYDRAVVGVFQTAAGLKADGIYGPQTVSALRYFGAKNVPTALFKGAAKAYAPPGG